MLTEKLIENEKKIIFQITGRWLSEIFINIADHLLLDPDLIAEKAFGNLSLSQLI
jgi:hypothetical protein